MTKSLLNFWIQPTARKHQMCLNWFFLFGVWFANVASAQLGICAIGHFGKDHHRPSEFKIGTLWLHAICYKEKLWKRNGVGSWNHGFCKAPQMRISFQKDVEIFPVVWWFFIFVELLQYQQPFAGLDPDTAAFKDHFEALNGGLGCWSYSSQNG